MSRTVFLSGVAMYLVAVAFLLTERFLGPTAAVTEANAERITKGMTVEEVERFLGPGKAILVGGAHAREWWNGPDFAVYIYFADGRVTDGPYAIRLEPPGGLPRRVTEPKPSLTRCLRSLLRF